MPRATTIAIPIDDGVRTASSSALAQLLERPARALVVVTMLASAVVFTEPAPVDLLMLLLFVALPMAQLVTITRPLAAFAALSLVPVAAAFLGTLYAIDFTPALTHTAVTAFLAGGSLLIAAFVMNAPERHTRLIFNAYTGAAIIAAVAGIIGYFNIIPGAGEIFTRYSRATGTFKDPNVFGPFLIAPFVYLLHRLLTPSQRFKPILAPAALLLAFGVLLSFSRGAWFCLAVATLAFALLSFITAPSAHDRTRVALIVTGAILAVTIVLTIALQFDAISDLMAHRASLSQGYDEGPEGRFGGQQKAKALIFANPLGIGAQQFGIFFHSEEAHNVYLSIFLNAGWIGGLAFIAIFAFTAIFGFNYALRRSTTQPLFLVAYVVFLAHALEGFIIDLDHWRHVHLLIGIVWGLMLAPEPTSNYIERPIRRARTLCAADCNITSRRSR